MTFSRNDTVWWHDPGNPDHLHHGWIESIERNGLAVAEAGRPSQVVTADHVHREDDQPPVATCPLCMRSATSQAAD